MHPPPVASASTPAHSVRNSYAAVLPPWQPAALDASPELLQRRQAVQTLLFGGALKRSKRVKPNEPCPCGSGKKYKKCCGAA